MGWIVLIAVIAGGIWLSSYFASANRMKRTAQIYIQDIQQNHLPLYRSFGPFELAQSRAAATIAFAFLTANQEFRNVGTLKALGVTENPIALAFLMMNSNQNLVADKQLIAQFSAYNLYIASVQREAMASSSPINQLVAAGITTWLTSIRTLICPELLPHSREVWKLLDSADATQTMNIIDSVVAQLLSSNHPLADVVSSASKLPTPSLFVPR